MTETFSESILGSRRRSIRRSPAPKRSWRELIRAERTPTGSGSRELSKSNSARNAARMLTCCAYH